MPQLLGNHFNWYAGTFQDGGKRMPGKVGGWDSFNGLAWPNQANWMTTSPLSTWYGVTLDGNGNVNALILPNNLLSGIVPSSLGNLANLFQLDLYNNQLSGNISSSLGNLTNLTYLDLGGNLLSDSIPSSLGNLTNLTYLDLGGNLLSDSIPSSLGNLNNLSQLNIRGNQLSGSIPTSLENLTNLTYLDFGYNQLSGGIPTFLRNLTKLTVLLLGNNQLSGGIPTSLGNLIPASVTETNYPAIQHAVINLLQSDDVTQFGNGFPSPTSIATECINGTDTMVKNSTGKFTPLSMIPIRRNSPVGINSYVQITSPARGAIFQQNSNSTVTLQFNPNDVMPADSAIFIINGVGWFLAPPQPPHSISFTLPANTSVGSLSVALLVKDTSGQLFGDTSSIFITPAGALDSISCNPVKINFDSSYRESFMTVNGYFSSGADTNVVNLSDPSVGTGYTAMKGGIFKVSSSGTVTALSPGIDTLVVTNSGLLRKIPVDVDSNFAYAARYPNSINFPTLNGPFYLQQPVGLSAYSTSGDTIHFSLVSGPATIQKWSVNYKWTRQNNNNGLGHPQRLFRGSC